jgi:AraC-like DNA-binding protein
LTSIIPLIRAAVLVPWINWLDANGIPYRPRLAEADLEYLSVDDPNSPVPLLNVFDFARRTAITEGIDIGCRVVSESIIEELANIGFVMRHGGTPRGALKRVAAALPRHCTHELIEIDEVEDGIIVSDVWQLDIDPETLHIVQQNVASIIQCICKLTGLGSTYFSYVRLVPHPDAGFDHLASYFHCPILPATRARLEVKIPNELADTPFVEPLSDGSKSLPTPEAWTRLRDGGTLAASARIALRVMFRSGTPTIEQLAFSAGMSARTLQRRLREESTAFSMLLDEVRATIAVEKLTSGDIDVATLARELGYSHTAALTRAVKRWTGKTPSGFRPRPNHSQRSERE